MYCQESDCNLNFGSHAKVPPPGLPYLYASCEIRLLLYKAVLSSVASSHCEAQHMSPGGTPKSQAVLFLKAGVCMCSEHMIQRRPTQGAVQWGNQGTTSTATYF